MNKLGLPYGRGRKCKTLSVADAAYIAGFLDGEGCFGAFVRRPTTLQPIQKLSLHVTVTITDGHILEWISHITGLGTAPKARQPKNTKHSKVYFWSCMSAGAASLVEQILPYLRIKGAQGRLLLAKHQVLLADKNKNVTDDPAWQNQVRRQFAKLRTPGASRGRGIANEATGTTF